ncbi:TetR family transcriptional regulator [Streptomyces sp. NPDC002845]
MQVRAARTRQALVDAAAQLFDSEGAKATDLLDISRSAGVSRGALYFHFESKNALATEVWQEARRHLRSLACTHPTEPHSSPESVGRFAVAVVQHLAQDPVLRAGMRLEVEGDIGPESAVLPLREEWLGLLRRHFGGLDDKPATSDLLTAVTVGLETLGRRDPYWWEQKTVSAVWELLGAQVRTET